MWQSVVARPPVSVVAGQPGCGHATSAAVAEGTAPLVAATLAGPVT